MKCHLDLLNINVDLIKIKVGLHTVREFVLPFVGGLRNGGGGGGVTGQAMSMEYIRWKC